MRLLGAAAGGASIVGWHSFQGDHDPEKAFYGMGLRQDGEDEQSKTSKQRLSWWVYQRLVDVVGAAKSYELILPADADTDPRIAIDGSSVNGNSAVSWCAVHAIRGSRIYRCWTIHIDNSGAISPTTIKSTMCTRIGGHC